VAPYDDRVPDRPASEEDRILAEDLRSAVSRFVRSTRAHADALTPGRAAALAQLELDGQRTIAQLAASRGVRHQGMSRTIAELEELGLVQRFSNPADRRGWVIELSHAGREAVRRDREARRDLLAARIAAVLDEPQRELARQVPGLLRLLTP
jgi:DNA-binding MarR family transcriptional regulator